MAAHPLTLNLIMQKARVDRPTLVRKLNVSGSQVDDISVIEQLTALEVVSLAANDVSDLGALSACQRLTELYLRKNDIVDLFQVLHLQQIPGLKVLTLIENPIAAHDCYRRYVIAALPQLEKLDDVVVTGEERAAARAEFPDVTQCEIPLPLPTKRELHGAAGTGTKSQSGSPQLKRGTPTGGPSGASFSSPPQNSLPTQQSPPAPAMAASTTQQPPASARVQSAAVVNAAQRRRSDADSDFGSDAGDMGAVPPRRGGSDHDDRPVGGAARGAAPLSARRTQQQFTDPSATSLATATPPADESPADDDAYDDSCDSSAAAGSYATRQQPPLRGQQHPGRGAASRGGQGSGGVRQTRPRIPLSPTPMGIREENVVRAVNLLLSELSPAGLDAVRRQLDMLDLH